VKHTEATVLKAVHNYFSSGYKYCIKNSFIFRYDWESDYFCVNREGYSFEVEAKISKADFKNDVKKEKHKLFDDNPAKRLLPNKFYYAVPRDLIKEEEIPKYAGLIYIDNTHATIVKRAPFIHKIKTDYRKILCDKFYYQWLSDKKKVHYMEYELEGAKNRLNNFFLFRFNADKKTWKIKTIDYPNKKVTGESETKWDKKTRSYENNVEIKEFDFNDVKFFQ
jgi:hypothetical protein